MLVGIHKNCYRRYTDRFETILDYNDIEHIRLDVDDPDFWQQVSKLDLFIYWWGHAYNERQKALTIIPIVENEIGITCLPNMRTCWSYDDKIREYYLLKHYGFPVIPFWIFWDQKLALEWLKRTPLPVVFKLKGGAGSTNVILVDDKSLGKRLIRRMFRKGMKSWAVAFGIAPWKDCDIKLFARRLGGSLIRRINPTSTWPGWELHKNYILFQKFLPNNDYDTRVTVIGDRAFAFRRFNRTNDFRASGSGKIDYDTSKIDMKFVTKAFEISKTMGFQSMAYDFLYDENDDVALCEISYTYVDFAVRDCPGYWDSSLSWHEGHNWPQYFQLMDTLELPDMRQPEMEK
jgi:glutathione synthase/RimK-type ligase-like ATP-grasp enzyme